ncbi:MAG: hypothetical protein Q9191_003742 [Dirinaria sp. TL-2023a]
MSASSEDTNEATSTETAERFIDTYYEALESHRDAIASFYMKATTLPDGKTFPSIVYNGNIKADGAGMQKFFQEEMPEMQFDIQAFDSQCLNPNYIPQGTTGGQAAYEKNMTILITVSGSVKLGKSRTAATKEFSESFVLVPNRDETGPRTRGKQVKEWVIQAQTFRVVV